jgi:hypothetical protein
MAGEVPVTFYTDLFTVQTWEAFQKNGGVVSGFRRHQRPSASRIVPGDIFVCYLVGLSRWCGLLKVDGPMYEDSTPIFADPDLFILRFKVTPLAMLDPEHSLPIHEPDIWGKLCITKEMKPREQGWAQFAGLRGSLRVLTDEDGEFLVDRIQKQKESKRVFELSMSDRRVLKEPKTVKTLGREVVVVVPEDDNHEADAVQIRASHKMQALIAEVGAKMGFKVWIPRADRAKVIVHIDKALHKDLIEGDLPLNYDDATLNTIEQIDVIWMAGRSMSRAFEVEHTTAVYSGLLRMADLLALQPNMDISLHIVAPDDRQEKVLRELKRPVFSLLHKGPLYESCSFIPYSSFEEIAKLSHLEFMKDGILGQYEERADES